MTKFWRLEYGWNAIPDEETQWEEYEEEDWMLFHDLQQARLNVLERQSRVDEFLQLAHKADHYRYTLKLLELGRVGEAILASQRLTSHAEILSIGQKLHGLGRVGEALTLVERGLNTPGHNLYELGIWLAPLEESLGRKEMAVQAYRAAFATHPTIELYRHLKRLSGSHWEELRPALIEKTSETQNPDTLAQIHLEEHNWDDAITLAEKHTWLLEKVVSGVTSERPDWVIRVSLKNANALIETTQSKHYPDAALWLAHAKQVYEHKGKLADWKAYITNLRATYARRPALQKAIANL